MVRLRPKQQMINTEERNQENPEGLNGKNEIRLIVLIELIDPLN